MRNRKLPLLLLLVLCGMAAFAGPVDKTKAQQNVMDFLRKGALGGPMKAVGTTPVLKEALATKACYVYNVTNANSYVIASASDKTQAILGYSDNGTVDPDNLPEAFQDWLENLGMAVETLETGGAQVKTLGMAQTVSAVAERTNIAPMVTSRWNQGDPYNLYTPSYVDKGVKHEHSATGCVATAMAQVMYYHKWPREATTAIPSYTYNWSGNTNTMPALEPVVLDWDTMTDTYNGSSSKASKEAVAQLMLYVGCGCKMGYGPASGAGTTNTRDAFIKYFDYNPDIYYAYQTNYTYQEWEDLFYSELSAGRPLLMNADNYERTGGHEFVCDGYKDGLWHMNWGWGGMCDGYFVLTVMAPDSQGIGGSSDSNGYSMGQGVMVNVRPKDGVADVETPRLSISGINCPYTTTSRQPAGTFRMSTGMRLHNVMLHKYNFDHAFNLCDADGNVVAGLLGLVENQEYSTNVNYTRNTTIEIPATVPDGVYYLKGVSRKTGTEEWLSDGYADRHYFILTIEGDKMAITPIPGQGTKLQINSVRLEGATKVGDWQKVVFNITNLGADFYGETYLFVDDVRSSGNMISVNSGETADIYYKVKFSSIGSHHLILSGTTGRYPVYWEGDKLTNNNVYWTADGKLSVISAGKQLTLAPDIVAVYITGTSPANITVGDNPNPNTVVYYDADATVSPRVLSNYKRKGLTNFVFGEVSDEITLHDGYQAYIPSAFTAKSASFTRENMPLWSTLVLPFDIQQVRVDDTDIDWFHSADDSGKQLFIKTYKTYGRGNLSFEYADACPANTAFLVGSAGSFGDRSFHHTGKSVTFSAANVLVQTSPVATIDASGHRLVGAYTEGDVDNAYVLDSATETFVPKSTGTKEPFHAYFLPKSGLSLAALRILFKDSEVTTGVDGVIKAEMSADEAVYDLKGVKVGTAGQLQSLPRGIYIVKGKKIVR